MPIKKVLSTRASGGIGRFLSKALTHALRSILCTGVRRIIFASTDHVLAKAKKLLGYAPMDNAEEFYERLKDGR